MRTSGRRSSQEIRLADQEACPRQPGHLARLPAQAVPPDPRPIGPDQPALPAERPKLPAHLVATWMTLPVPLVMPPTLGSTWPVLKAFRPVPRTFQPVQPIQPSARAFQLLHKELGPDNYQLQDMHLEEVSTPVVPPGAMTRSRSRALFHKFSLWVDKLLEEDRQRTMGQKYKEESKGFSTMQGTSETWALVAREVRAQRFLTLLQVED
ncbi:hypothetical protein BSL78_24899 [Apostichopus japonicus]|uniref:Uncharacterized protein n=1 Tax=Stichopus japonicus TaxID=307972 RepID=A0A2G8JR66_STIJA|nr:hypothetical protein BSL78_24899 [Apostichopus japonicus]